MFCLLYSFVLLYRKLMSIFYMINVLGDCPFRLGWKITAWEKYLHLRGTNQPECRQEWRVTTTVLTVILTLLSRPWSTDIHFTQKFGSLCLCWASIILQISWWRYLRLPPLYNKNAMLSSPLWSMTEKAITSKNFQGGFVMDKSEISHRKGARSFFQYNNI